MQIYDETVELRDKIVETAPDALKSSGLDPWVIALYCAKAYFESGGSNDSVKALLHEGCGVYCIAIRKEMSLGDAMKEINLLPSEELQKKAERIIHDWVSGKSLTFLHIKYHRDMDGIRGVLSSYGYAVLLSDDCTIDMMNERILSQDFRDVRIPYVMPSKPYRTEPHKLKEEDYPACRALYQIGVLAKDIVTMMGVTIDEYKEFCKQYPDISTIRL